MNGSSPYRFCSITINKNALLHGSYAGSKQRAYYLVEA